MLDNYGSLSALETCPLTICGRRLPEDTLFPVENSCFMSVNSLNDGLAFRRLRYARSSHPIYNSARQKQCELHHITMELPLNSKYTGNVDTVPATTVQNN